MYQNYYSNFYIPSNIIIHEKSSKFDLQWDAQDPISHGRVCTLWAG